MEVFLLAVVGEGNKAILFLFYFLPWRGGGGSRGEGGQAAERKESIKARDINTITLFERLGRSLGISRPPIKMCDKRLIIAMNAVR